MNWIKFKIRLSHLYLLFMLFRKDFPDRAIKFSSMSLSVNLRSLRDKNSVRFYRGTIAELSKYSTTSFSWTSPSYKMVFSAGQLKLIASYHHCWFKVTLEVQHRFGGMCEKLKMEMVCRMIFDIWWRDVGYKILWRERICSFWLAGYGKVLKLAAGSGISCNSNQAGSRWIFWLD